MKQPHVFHALPLCRWDLVVVDEAHEVAGRSDRHVASHALAQRSRRVMLLTATPHNGDPSAFARLRDFGELDDVRSSGGGLVVLRRTPSSLGWVDSRRVRWHRVTPTVAEQRALDTLLEFEKAVLGAAGRAYRSAALLLLSVLRKRGLSTMAAMAVSLRRRAAWLDAAGPENAVDWRQPRLDFAGEPDDAFRDEENVALSTDVGFGHAREQAWLRRLLALIDRAAVDDSKVRHVARLVARRHEPVIVFTEFRHSLEAVCRRLGTIAVVTTLHGGQTSHERRSSLRQFLNGDADVLVATDVASQGLNLQTRSRWVINLELPWNPARLAQRAGRVDRIGQTRPVHVTLVVSRHQTESELLTRVAERAVRAKEAMGVNLAGVDWPTEPDLAAELIAGSARPRRASAEPAAVPIDQTWRRHARWLARLIRRRRLWAAQWRDADPHATSTLVARLRAAPVGLGPSGGWLLVFRTSIVDATGAVLETRLAAFRGAADATKPLDRALVERARSIATLRVRRRCDRIRRLMDNRTRATSAIDRAIDRHLHAARVARLAQPGLFDRPTTPDPQSRPGWRRRRDRPAAHDCCGSSGARRRDRDGRMRPTILPGVAGSLLPARFLADGLWKAHASNDPGGLARGQVHLERWWRRVSEMCGPATGIRAVADLVATPLAGMLGFRVRTTVFDGPRAALRLEPRHGADSPVAMLVLPWSSRPSMAWRDLVGHARMIGASWGFVLAPPYLSLVDVRAPAVRRSIDFALPEAFDGRSFAAFWALASARSFNREPTGGRQPPAARIDRIVAASTVFADGVRRDLQGGVIQALAELVTVVGGGPASRFDEALTIIYRVLFLLFAESRDLVPHRHPVYQGAYTIGGLARQALDARHGAPHVGARGLWDGLGAMTRLSRLGCDTGDLIVRPFNGRLFARHTAPSLEPARAPARVTPASAKQDNALGAALVALATRPTTGGRETIDYADLGVEQLGAVYERVLDINPGDRTAWRTRRRVARHSETRKASGTFYTPQALSDFLVRRTLTPLVSGATSDDILGLRVVDPSMGSGAFLVSACRFLASAYEEALVEEGRTAPVEFDEHERADVRRLVAERCLYGVDANPTAVQLARLSLWLATLAHGKPLTFLDHRLRAGNSLIGTSPDRLRRVPDGTRRAVRHAALPLMDLAALEAPMRAVVRPMVALAARRDDTVDDVRAKEAAWASLSGERSPLRRWRTAADLWCARWFSAATRRRQPRRGPRSTASSAAIPRSERLTSPDASPTPPRRRSLTASSTGRLSFPRSSMTPSGHRAIDRASTRVIGNPPWEMLRRDSAGQEWPRRFVEFIRRSGFYPSSDRGHVKSVSAVRGARAGLGAARGPGRSRAAVGPRS